MKNITTQILYSYWNDVRLDRVAPMRFDIEPSRIAGILGETMILEELGPEHYRFRLAGSRLVEHFGMELRGFSFLDLWPTQEHRDVAVALETIAEGGGAAVLEIEAAPIAGQCTVMEAIILPLIHTRGVIDRFLGAISIAEAPQWLTTEPIQSLRLLRRRIIHPDGRQDISAIAQNEPPPLIQSAPLSRTLRDNRRTFKVLIGGRQ